MVFHCEELRYWLYDYSIKRIWKENLYTWFSSCCFFLICWELIQTNDDGCCMCVCIYICVCLCVCVINFHYAVAHRLKMFTQFQFTNNRYLFRCLVFLFSRLLEFYKNNRFTIAFPSSSSFSSLMKHHEYACPKLPQ